MANMQTPRPAEAPAPAAAEPTTATAPPEATQAETNGTSTDNRPLQTVRSGSVAASIWENDNGNISITLSRSWKADGAEEYNHSKNFFASNRAALHEVIDEACTVAQALERSAKRRQDLASDVPQ